MGKKEPRNDGPEPNESQETGDDHHTYRPSVFRHRFAPFVSSRHGGHNVYHSIYHNTTNSDILSDRYSPTLPFPPCRNPPSLNRPRAAIQLPAPRTAIRAHCWWSDTT